MSQNRNVYIYRAAMYCEPCGEALRARVPRPAHANAEDESSFDSDEWPAGPYGNAGGESDTPQHCEGCGVFLENPLTADGVEYVRTARRTPVSVEWRDFYGLPPFGHGGVGSLDSRRTLRSLGLDAQPDFFTLRQSMVAELLTIADSVGYRAPANANGSRGRYFYAALCRAADRAARLAAERDAARIARK